MKLHFCLIVTEIFSTANPFMIFFSSEYYLPDPTITGFRMVNLRSKARLVCPLPVSVEAQYLKK